jgi:hypothetical protein
MPLIANAATARIIRRPVFLDQDIVFPLKKKTIFAVVCVSPRAGLPSLLIAYYEEKTALR